MDVRSSGNKLSQRQQFQSVRSKWAYLVDWLIDQSLLFEAFLVAITFHILLLPVLWVAGWALPWPKSPRITTVIEYDLRNWPQVARPKKIIDIREPEPNQ